MDTTYIKGIIWSKLGFLVGIVTWKELLQVVAAITSVMASSHYSIVVVATVMPVSVPIYYLPQPTLIILLQQCASFPILSLCASSHKSVTTWVHHHTSVPSNANIVLGCLNKQIALKMLYIQSNITESLPGDKDLLSSSVAIAVILAVTTRQATVAFSYHIFYLLIRLLDVEILVISVPTVCPLVSYILRCTESLYIVNKTAFVSFNWHYALGKIDRVLITNGVKFFGFSGYATNESTSGSQYFLIMRLEELACIFAQAVFKPMLPTIVATLRNQMVVLYPFSTKTIAYLLAFTSTHSSQLCAQDLWSATTVSLRGDTKTSIVCPKKVYEVQSSNWGDPGYFLGQGGTLTGSKTFVKMRSLVQYFNAFFWYTMMHIFMDSSSLLSIILSNGECIGSHLALQLQNGSLFLQSLVKRADKLNLLQIMFLIRLSPAIAWSLIMRGSAGHFLARTTSQLQFVLTACCVYPFCAWPALLIILFVFLWSFRYFRMLLYGSLTPHTVAALKLNAAWISFICAMNTASICGTHAAKTTIVAVTHMDISTMQITDLSNLPQLFCIHNQQLKFSHCCFCQ